MFETVAGWIIWGIAAVGYVGILALTERSAERYVKNPAVTRQTASIRVIAADPTAPAPSRAPAFEPSSPAAATNR